MVAPQKAPIRKQGIGAVGVWLGALGLVALAQSDGALWPMVGFAILFSFGDGINSVTWVLVGDRFGRSRFSAAAVQRSTAAEGCLIEIVCSRPIKPGLPADRGTLDGGFYPLVPPADLSVNLPSLCRLLIRACLLFLRL